MIGRAAEWVLAASLLIPALAGAGDPGAAPGLSAAQIIEKNAAARGGVEAWRKIQTMAWAGHVESPDAPARRLPFLLEQKRPNRTRFEIMAPNSRPVRVFDGSQGWRMVPESKGPPRVTEYTADELSFARDSMAIEGPLMDAAARGLAVTLGSVDEIDGRKCYRLDFSPRAGATHRVWVDAKTFLERRYDREFRTSAGRPARVSVLYADYHTLEGLQIPVAIETGAAGGKPGDKLVIEKIALNPQLEDGMFAKPNVPLVRHRGLLVDTREPTSAQQAGPNVAPRAPAPSNAPAAAGKKRGTAPQ